MTSVAGLRIAVIASFVYFEECGQGICRGLEALGFSPELMEGIPVSGDWDVILVIGVHLFPEIPWMPDTLVLGIQTEQMPVYGVSTGRLARNERRYHSVSGYYDHLFEWNPDLYVLRNDGRTFLPYGCGTERFEDTPKKFEVAFIGNVGGSARRERLLGQLQSRFLFYPDYSPGFGDRKKQAIRESSILLNIHFYDGAGFESPRMFDYLALGAFVLSERTACSFPFARGVDFEGFEGVDDLVLKIDFYLSHPESRRAIAKQGFETAQRFHFNACARLLGMEILRRMVCHASNAVRYRRWLQAKLHCLVFQSKDWLSGKRRAFFDSPQS